MPWGGMLLATCSTRILSFRYITASVMAGTAACGKNTATVIERFVGACDTVAIGVVEAGGAIIGTIRMVSATMTETRTVTMMGAKAIETAATETEAIETAAISTKLHA